jgi:hypothetical protein
VEKQRKTEEQLKVDIFNIYSCYFYESSSDRRQVTFARICKVIISWCTDYLKIKANEMGTEIFDAVNRLVKDGNNNVPKDEDEYFKYLKKVLYRAEKEYFRKNQAGSIHISNNTRRRLRIIDDIITAKESNAGRKLTENERQQYVSQWFSKTDYSKLMNLKKIGSLNVGDDNEIDLLNSEVKPPYMRSASINPIDEYLLKLDMESLKNALEFVLKDRQERSRECYRSLFTAYCIDRSKNFESLVPVLDNEILEAHRKEGKKPKQYEIYLKYHPEAKKDSAEARSSQMLKVFLNKLEKCLKEKNPEIFHFEII